MAVVVYQGEPGSYSEEAVWSRFAGMGFKAVGHRDFVAVVEALVAGDASRAVLPVQNTVMGPIQTAVDAMEPHALAEVDRFWRRVDHCLIGHPGTSHDRIQRVYSHPAALEQCQHYLAGQGFEAIAADDTAGAVRQVRERGDAAEAAIASRRAAAIHHMQVIDVSIQDRADNRTQFVTLAMP